MEMDGKKKHKSEGDVPTMEDLAPYLGEWTNHIARFVSWGVTYKITPISEMESQSDVCNIDPRFAISERFLPLLSCWHYF
jgi:hypothetical protein